MRKMDYKYFSKAKQIAKESDFSKVHMLLLYIQNNWL